MNYSLGFISDEDIRTHVTNTVNKYRNSIDLKQFNQNLIDPIKLTFDAKIYQRGFDELINDECARQIDKSNTNNIGYFHQNIFNYANNGWVVQPNGVTGFDVENENLHIFAELKNKHNTMNSSSAQKTYMKMQQKILRDDRATCILVETIAKSSQNKTWEITVDKEKFSNDRIRRVSMDKFYGIVFNDDHAFFKLCKALPDILDDVLTSTKFHTSISNTVFDELSEKSPNQMKSLYLLAFEKYDGFNLL